MKFYPSVKLTIVLLALFCTQLSAAAFSQRISLNQHNVPLEQVLKEIKRQTGYFFLYDLDLIQQQSKPVNIKVSNASIEDVMTKTLQSQPFSWEIKERTILIKPLQSGPGKNQKEKGIDIRGKVTDENGTGLPGASVKVKGSSIAAITDQTGSFNLKNVEENAVLLVSYIGYLSQEVRVQGQVLTIQLQPQTSAL